MSVPSRTRCDERCRASASAVRCRFAPAPSGSLHVGNVRGALFSWLFARHHGEDVVLRVEDTDASRVTEEAVAGVLETCGSSASITTRARRRWSTRRTAGPGASASTGTTPSGCSPRATRIAATARPMSWRIARKAAMVAGETRLRRPLPRSLRRADRRFEAEGGIGRALPHARPRVGGRRRGEGEVRFGPGQLRDFVLRVPTALPCSCWRWPSTTC